MIHSLCYRMTGSVADAEDLAQETFILAFRHLESFRGESAFQSWLYRIAINQCLNWKKSQARRQVLNTDYARQQESNPAASQSPAADQVREALLQLNPKQRAAIVLTTYDGLSHAEAARTLGCSETTVSWRVFAARARLKRLLRHAKP